MSEETYEKAFGKKPEIKTALVIAGEDAERGLHKKAWELLPQDTMRRLP